MGSDDRDEPTIFAGVNRTKDFLDIVPHPVGSEDPAELHERARARGRPVAVIVGVLVGVAVAGAVGWLVLTGMGDGEEPTGGDAPLIEAEPGSVKVHPDEPGGLDIPNRDRKVYETINPSGDQPQDAPAEHLAPPPPEPKPLAEVTQQPPPPMPETTMKQMPLPSAPPPPPGAATDPAAESATVAPQEIPAAPPPKVVDMPKVVAPEPAPAPAPVAKAAPAVKPTTAPAAKAVPATAASGGWMAQLLAARDAAGAEQAWTALARKHADLLGGKAHVVARADLGTKGIFYRLRVGPFTDKPGAGALCDALMARKVDCRVVANN